VAAEKKQSEPLGLAELDAAALRYLNRFDATQKKLGDHLLRVARKRGGDAATARAHIDQLLERYRGSGLIDDRRFATHRAQALQSRGASRRLVAQKLMQSGVARELVDQVLAESATPQSELEAAAAYVRRKRLGRFRTGDASPDTRRKDLMRLARQGFDFDTARRALGFGGGDDF
jgi:regulatory protein